MVLEVGRDGNYALVFNNANKIAKAIYENDFSQYGNVINTKTVNKLVFVRYKHRWEAEACLVAMRSTSNYNVRPATNKPRDSDSDNTDTESILYSNCKKAQSYNAFGGTSSDENSSICQPPKQKSILKNSASTHSLDKFSLGCRSDGLTHLFITNLKPQTTHSHIKQLLTNFEYLSISKIYQTLPEQPISLNYVMVTMRKSLALEAMDVLNGTILFGSPVYVLEVAQMYEEAVKPLQLFEDNSQVIPPTLEEIARKQKI